MPNTLLLAFAAAFLFGAAAIPQDPDAPTRPNPNPPDPMARFEFLVGGTWHSEEPAYHDFQWGLGRKSIIGRTYIPGFAGPALVAESRWFWHPGKAAIVGNGVLESMPFEVIEMTGEWRNGKLHGAMQAFKKDGTVMEYSEVWEFVDKNHYDWKMYQDEKLVMQTSFERHHADKK